MKTFSCSSCIRFGCRFIVILTTSPTTKLIQRNYTTELVACPKWMMMKKEKGIYEILLQKLLDRFIILQECICIPGEWHHRSYVLSPLLLFFQLKEQWETHENNYQVGRGRTCKISDSRNLNKLCSVILLSS